MAKIVIKDLAESQELDRQALTKIVGGKGPALFWQSGHRSPLWPNTATIAESQKPLGAWLKSLTGD
jgi:hypothetical protein